MQTIWFKVKYNNDYDNVKDIDPEVVQDSYSEGESEVVLRLPDSYCEWGEPTPLIFTAHGSGGRVCKEENATGGLGYVNECVKGGYAAFDIHGTRPDGRSYGSRKYCEAVHRAYVYILNHYNVERDLFVAGASMGGVSTLNYVSMYPNTVRVLGLYYPRTNLHEVELHGVRYHGSYEVYKESIDMHLYDVIGEQYGFTENSVWEEEKVRGLNPWDNKTITVDGVRYATLPCPIKIWHGNADMSVQYDMSVEYIAALRRSGCFAELRTMDGRGHKHNDIMHKELKLWFDRFR